MRQDLHQKVSRELLYSGKGEFKLLTVQPSTRKSAASLAIFSLHAGAVISQKALPWFTSDFLRVVKSFTRLSIADHSATY